MLSIRQSVDVHRKKLYAISFSAICHRSNVILLFFVKLQRVFEMAGTQTKAVLSKLSKQELIQLFLKTEANLG